MALKPYYDDGNGTVIYCGDCREILPTLGTFDLLLTDPPYGIAEKWNDAFVAKNGNSKLRDGNNEWDAEPCGSDVISAMLKMTDRAIIWGGNYYAMPPASRWLLWDKVQVSTAGADAEMAWTNLEGVVRCYRMSRIDAYHNVGHEKKQHPTQKPLTLIRWCLTFCADAQTILDPFAGSCTTGVAAKLEGRKCTMIEREERYCEIGANRLRQNVLQFAGSVKR